MLDYAQTSSAGSAPIEPTAPASAPVALAPSGPQVRKRLEWTDLPDEAQESYPGFRVRIWANYRRSLTAEIGSGDADRLRAALVQIIVEHNGWLNDEGQPYSPASDPRFWDEIPDELAAVLIVLVRRASTKLPNSLLRASSS